jgi:D-alanyl-D-alanine carboxypeptidase/D-alanyl-D-alanine-endopeptidase (penicillin-binding protein 4)
MPATNELAQQSVRKALDGLAIRWDKVRLGNGSGLYHADQVTCEAVVDLLRSMATDPAGPVWRDSLPIGGRDGTLRGRQHSFAGKVRAKTGTLDDVSGLAGYAESGDRRYYFAFFFNNLRGGPGPVRGAQDRTLQRLLQ